MLSASPRLRRLILRRLDPQDGTSLQRSGSSPRPDQNPIHLPALETISIQSVTDTFCRELIGRIDAPKCNAMEIPYCHHALFHPWSGSTLPSTIKSMMKSANRVSVSYYSSSEREERQIVVETRPNVRIREMGGLAVQECPGLRVVVRLDEDGDWRSVVESLDFGSLPNNLGVWFCFDQKQGGVGSDSESQLSEWITIMGGHGAAFETVALDEAFDPIPALRYLSTPQIDESNRQYWACPLLKSVYIDNAATWSDQQDEELEQLCIAFLRRSDQAVEGLTPPKQVKDLLVERGKISATLERMGEFTGVRLSSD